MTKKNENRREFLTRTTLGLTSLSLLLTCRGESLATPGGEGVLDLIRKNAIKDPGCDWCGARDVPDDVKWRTTLKPPKKGGTPIAIRGTVYQANSDKPAANALLYFYHTDTAGLYGRGGQHRHGYFRGWVLTDKKGQYEFATIKPASYPNSRNASHIHMTLTTQHHKEDWLDSILFEGDRFITARQRTIRKGGFNPILELSKGENGVYVGRRDIRLPVI